MLTSSRLGKVWLVGAGPGDPELLTIKALNCLKTADLVLLDQLVSEEIKALIPANIKIFFVGKSKNHHSLSQTDINNLMIKKAKAGLQVVRLKGGDPFVFGRGGEEVIALRKHHVEVEVVPGITAGSGCTTAAGIPLTHRGITQGCTFVTAHAENELSINWPALVAAGNTLVFYMGVSKSEYIKQSLISAGMNGSTAVAVVENGSRKNQRKFFGALVQLDEIVKVNNVSSPALIVVGEVVELAEIINCKQVDSEVVMDLTTKCA